MLVRGQMAQRVERGDCVGAGRPQGEPTHVGLDQRRRRRSFPCQPQLSDRGVKSQDDMFRRQHAGRWLAGATPKFDDEAAWCQLTQQEPHEVQAGRRCPLCQPGVMHRLVRND